MTPEKRKKVFQAFQNWLSLAQAEHQLLRKKRWSEINSLSDSKTTILEQLRQIQPRFDPVHLQSDKDLQVLTRQVADLETLNQSLLREGMKEIQLMIKETRRRRSEIFALRRGQGRATVHSNSLGVA